MCLHARARTHTHAHICILKTYSIMSLIFTLASAEDKGSILTPGSGGRRSRAAVSEGVLVGSLLKGCTAKGDTSMCASLSDLCPFSCKATRTQP